MVFILPSERSSLPELEAQLDGEAMGEVLDRMFGRRLQASVDLALPKFEVRTPVVLNDALQELGVRRVFTASAQLGGIADGSLMVSLVRHKAFDRIDEKGMEAAAATAVVMKRGGGPVAGERLSFHADRPFLFALVDRQSRLLLFAGRVVHL